MPRPLLVEAAALGIGKSRPLQKFGGERCSSHPLIRRRREWWGTRHPARDVKRSISLSVCAFVRKNLRLIGFRLKVKIVRTPIYDSAFFVYGSAFFVG
jgi:hypothetical protein